MNSSKGNTTRATIVVSLVLALASLGDTLIYPVLSSDYQAFGVPFFWVGILLSVNRLVRLVANRLVAYAIQVMGLRRSSIWAATIAAVSTMMYALNHQLIGLLVARIGWGVAYATLRINTIHVALEGEKKGWQLGLSGAFYEVGPLLALGIGPMLIKAVGIQITFIALGVLSFVGVYLAFGLPQSEGEAQDAQIARLDLPRVIEQLVFVVALVIEGALVVVMATLFLQVGVKPNQLIALTAFYLIIRRLSGLLFAPLVGWLADTFGLKKVFMITLIGVVIALLMISVGGTESVFLKWGLIASFISARMFANLSPAMAIQMHPTIERLHLLASLTTWRDLGAALGALLGLVVLQMLGTSVLFGIATFVILIYTLWILKNEH